MFEAFATGEQIQADVQDGISLVVGKMQLQDGDGIVDVFTRVRRFDQLADDGESSTVDRLLSFGKLDFRRRRPDHRRLPLAAKHGDPFEKFAFVKLFSYLSVHSKPSVE